jgi:Cache 3/Cache 2 fusion domain
MIRTGELIAVRAVRLITKTALVVLVIAIGLPGRLMLMASAADAQDARSATSMAALKDKTAKLGAPKIQGTEAVGSKSYPALYFGSTKMNNNSTIVDEVGKEGGTGMAATLFVKAGDEFIRVATSVLLPDGRRAVGTVLRPPALANLIMAKSRFLARYILLTTSLSKTHRVKPSAPTSLDTRSDPERLKAGVSSA